MAKETPNYIAVLHLLLDGREVLVKLQVRVEAGVSYQGRQLWLGEAEINEREARRMVKEILRYAQVMGELAPSADPLNKIVQRELEALTESEEGTHVGS